MKTWNGYPEMFSFSQALEISRQNLLFRTVILQNIVADSPEFCKDSRFQWGSPYDIGSKRTNHQFGCFRRGLPVEYSYSIKETFYLKMCISFFFFSSKSGDFVSNYASVGIYFFKVLFLFFFFDRRMIACVAAGPRTHLNHLYSPSI